MDHLEDTPVQINGSSGEKKEKIRTFMLCEASAATGISKEL